MNKGFRLSATRSYAGAREKEIQKARLKGEGTKADENSATSPSNLRSKEFALSFGTDYGIE